MDGVAGVDLHTVCAEFAYGGVDYFASVVNEQSYGDGVDGADGGCGGGAFSEDGVGDTVGCGEDCGFRVGVGVIDDAENLQVVGVGGLEALEGGHLDDAGAAPGSPEVQDDGLVLKARWWDGVAAEELQI